MFFIITNEDDRIFCGKHGESELFVDPDDTERFTPLVFTSMVDAKSFANELYDIVSVRKLTMARIQRKKSVTDEPV